MFAVNQDKADRSIGQFVGYFGGDIPRSSWS